MPISTPKQPLKKTSKKAEQPRICPFPAYLSTRNGKSEQKPNACKKQAIQAGLKTECGAMPNGERFIGR